MRFKVELLSGLNDLPYAISQKKQHKCIKLSAI